MTQTVSNELILTTFLLAPMTVVMSATLTPEIPDPITAKITI